MATQAKKLRGAPGTAEGVWLVADVGGTHVRFATVDPPGHFLRDVRVLACAAFPTLGAAVEEYLTQTRVGSLKGMCMAVAGPVGQDQVALPNNHWAFSVRAVEKEMGAPLTVINDFTAQAMALDALEPGDLLWLGTPRPATPGVRTVLGPGTGLGIAVKTVQGPVIPSEGGHMGFAPTNEHEIDLFRHLLLRFRRVSAERLISGPGLENIYRANRQIAGTDPLRENEVCPASRVAALAGRGDPIALQSVQDFFDIMASFAGDVALFTLSTGGIYLSGGVMRHLAEFLDVPRFRSRFEDKGRLSGFCTRTPLAWITHDYPGLLGCAALLEQGTPHRRHARSTAPC